MGLGIHQEQLKPEMHSDRQTAVSSRYKANPWWGRKASQREKHGARLSGACLGPQSPVSVPAGGGNTAACRVAVCPLFSRFSLRRQFEKTKSDLKEKPNANGLNKREVPVRG